MGYLKNGQWVDQWFDTKKTGGEFIREDSQFRNQIGEGQFRAEAGRYHLYVSLACPWAHRTLIMRQMKGLQDIITVSVVEPLMLEHGWTFSQSGDGLYGLAHLHQIYSKAQADYSGRVTVPVLWDKKLTCIVNNESAEIVRQFNTAFNGLTGNTVDYYPQSLRAAIDAFNTRIYHTVNNGVYRAGFATTQTAYEQAFQELFATLDWLDAGLRGNQYLLGEQITEADWRLFTTLIRFDAVYYSHFKTNLRRIVDYPHLSRYLRDLYHQPGVAQTVDIAHIKMHYYGSHRTINPTGIVPVGPALDFLGE